MSKPSKSGRTGGKHHHKRKSPAKQPSTASSDAGLFIGLALIGAFGVFILRLTTSMPWELGALGFVLFMAGAIDLSVVQAVWGDVDLGWRKGLARLPLRFVGYGVRGGKPLEAAKGSEKAKKAAFITIALSVILVVGLSYVVVQ